nr:unnamed protein product [Callosobruchus chinensis]
MTTKRIRNRGCMPYLQTEGVFERAPPIEVQKAEAICSSSSPFVRLFRHNTLASARKNFLFKPFRLRNTRDLTPDREEQASQANKTENGEDEKVGAGEGKSKPTKKQQLLSKKGIRPVVKLPFRYNFAQKLLVGGITERRHPSNIKLMNSSHHSPQTNAGYSRQPSDGNFYQYLYIHYRKCLTELGIRN